VTDSLAALLVSSAGQLCWSALLVSSAGRHSYSAAAQPRGVSSPLTPSGQLRCRTEKKEEKEEKKKELRTEA